MLISRLCNIILLLFLFTGGSFLNKSKANQSRQYNIKSEISYLKKFNGRYPYKVKLLGNNPLTKRLKILMKNRYNFLQNTWAVETPIEIKNNIFIAWGCQQHNCGNTNFIIVVDFTKNIVYVGIREEESVKVYSEDGSSNAEVLKWANRN